MKKTLFIFTFFASLLSNGQDLVYTQNFGSPLYVNPAFAGNLAKTSFHLNAREQWPSISGSYSSSSFSANHRLDKINSGVGVIIKQDEEGSASYKSLNISGIYSYQLHLNKNWTLSPALQMTYMNNRFDKSTFVFGDQINEDFTVSNTVNEDISFNSISFFDASSGVILYDENVWLGFSTHHITQPKNFIGSTASLNRKYSFHSGFEYSFRPPTLREEITITPSVNINYQDPFTRFGLNFLSSYHFFTIGTGISNITSSFSNQNILNSFILAGYSDDNIRLGYSYDFTVRGAVGLGGAHEISLGVLLNYENNNRKYRPKHKKIRKVSCPKF